MKNLRIFLVLAVAILGLSFTNVKAQSGGSDNPDQLTIERKIFKEINKLPYYGLFDDISYQVSGSSVILTGKVVRSTTKSDAKNVVAHVAGISEVINNIEVLPLSGFDDQIRYQVANTLAKRGGSFYRYLSGTNPSVHIIVENSKVTLEGYVANKSDASLANVLTNGVFGVLSVQNNLIVEKNGANS